MPERPEHRVRERAFVPGAVVAAAVDEERGREAHAARPRARHVLVDTLLGLRHDRRLLGLLDAQQVGGNGFEVLVAERRRAGHERYVRIPKLLGIRRTFDELGRAAGALAARDGTMA